MAKPKVVINRTYEACWKWTLACEVKEHLRNPLWYVLIGSGSCISFCEDGFEAPAVFQSWISKISPSQSTGDTKSLLAQPPNFLAELKHEQNCLSPTSSLPFIMPSSHCVFNSATALRRVFIPSNYGSSHSLHLTRIFVPALLALPPQARAYWAGRNDDSSKAPPRPRSAIFDRDSYARTPRPAGGSGFNARRAGAARPQQKKEVDPDTPGPRVGVKLGRMPRDNEIDWPYVYVKTSGVEGSEGLGPPRPIKEVLAELDPKTVYLEAVVVPRSDDRSSPRWPICRIVNKKEELAKLKDLKERKKKGAVKEKELELNWTLAPHDLDHKLKTLQKFLSKGYKVQLLLQKKARAKVTATEEDAKALIEKVTQTVAEVKGAKEWKGREGQMLARYMIFLQGKVQDEAAPAPATVAKETSATSGDGVADTPPASSDAAEESEGSSTGTQS